MKRILLAASVFMLLIMTGCTNQLQSNQNSADEVGDYDLFKVAKETKDPEVITKDLLEPKDYYIPSRIDFFMYDTDWEEIDVSDYLFVEMACPGMSVFENCVGPDMGGSMQGNGVHIMAEGDTSTLTLETTIYILRNVGFVMGFDVVLENIVGDTKIEPGSNTDVDGSVVVGLRLDTLTYEQNHRILDFKYTVVEIDVLDSVEIREFDIDDNLLENTTVSKEELLDELTLNDDTFYYFIIENYEDLDGGYYEERSYYDLESCNSYLYKFTNEDGFLDGDMLTISK